MILVLIGLAALGACLVFGCTLVLAGVPLGGGQGRANLAVGVIVALGIALALAALLVYALKGAALH